MLLFSREGLLFSSCTCRMVDDHFGSFRDCVKSRLGCSPEEDGLPGTHPWPPEVSVQSLIYSVGPFLRWVLNSHFCLLRMLQSSALVFKGFHLSFLFAALYCLGFGKCSEGKIALCLRPPEPLPKDVNSLCPSPKLCTGFSALCSCPASANAVTEVGSFFQGYPLSVESKPLYLSLP